MFPLLPSVDIVVGDVLPKTHIGLDYWRRSECTRIQDIEYDEPIFRIKDSHEWFADLFSLPIEKSGLLFFEELGYIEKNAHAIYRTSVASRFIHSLSEGILISPLDRMTMDSMRESCHLFNLSVQDENDIIPIYAIDLDCSHGDRSSYAQDIHTLISRINMDMSIVFFRLNDAILLSFSYVNSEGIASIVLSEWFSENDIDYGQLDRLHVSNMPLNSAYSLFDCLAQEAMREYYKQQISGLAIRRYLLDIPDACIGPDSVFDSFRDVGEAANTYIHYLLRQYGDDFVERISFDLASYKYCVEEEFGLDVDEFEWQIWLDESDETDPVAEIEIEDDPSDEDVGFASIEEIPDELFSDPIALTEWLESH